MLNGNKTNRIVNANAKIHKTKEVNNRYNVASNIKTLKPELSSRIEGILYYKYAI